MKLDNLLWLLPIVFMIHEFEEIIMMHPWAVKNRARLAERYPPLVSRLAGLYGSLSASSIALAAGEEFVLISLATYLAVEYHLYAMWMGLFAAFFIHLIIHVGQGLIYGRYVPVILTSVLASIYGFFVLFTLPPLKLFTWGAAGLWTAGWLVLIVTNLIQMNRVAARFERWLTGAYAAE